MDLITLLVVVLLVLVLAGGVSWQSGWVGPGPYGPGLLGVVLVVILVLILLRAFGRL